MKQQIGFLGVGQCGGNIVNLFDSKGYRCAYLNTSVEDLNSFKGNYKIHIKGGEGASKNRKAALQLAAKSIDIITTRITDVLPQEYVVVCFAAGGGTGSGLSPFICSYLTQLGKTVVPVIVLPNEAIESVKTCKNAYNCCKDLSSINTGAIFLLDNSRMADKFSINIQFVKEFDAMLNMSTNSSLGNIDKSEIKTLLKTSGISIISKLSKTKSNMSQILYTFRDNIYAEIENKRPMLIGVSTCNKSLRLDELTIEFQTSLYDTFYGVSDNRTVVVLSGMQWPMERINKYKERAKSLNLPQKSHNLFEDLDPKIKEVQVTNGKTEPLDSRSLLMNFLK